MKRAAMIKYRHCLAAARGALRGGRVAVVVVVVSGGQGGGPWVGSPDSSGSLTAEPVRLQGKGSGGLLSGHSRASLTRSRDELHCNTLQGNGKEREIEGRDFLLFFFSYSNPFTCNACKTWDSSPVHRSSESRVEPR